MTGSLAMCYAAIFLLPITPVFQQLWCGTTEALPNLNQFYACVRALARIDSTLLCAAVCAGGGVLVHCQAGISRSAAIVIAYCMWKERLSAAAATAVVSAARDAIWPNMGFKTQLQEFEKLGWDASKWQGWNMDKFLQTRYGHDSVDFMATMLGGAPEDRVARRQQQCTQGRSPEHVADSPLAHWGADSSADYSSVLRQSGAGHVQGEEDSCRKCSADQCLAARATSKTARPPSAVCGASHGGQPEVAGSSCGGCCRQGPSTTRRMSLACYCGPAGGTAAAMHGSSSGSSNRLRRHSTGQYALAAAAAGVTAMHLGNYKHMSYNTGTRLPEEAALLMAG
jgi:hypothetical protein